MSNKRGKLIPVYGINGVGKTEQVRRLVEYLCSLGIKASSLKFPVYDLEPEGPLLHKYLRVPKFREENKISDNDLQLMFMKNRERYEPELIKRLESGEWIIAEDYTGTGISWGLTRGVSLSFLEKINRHLLKSDVEILMDGERFTDAIEEGHRNEQDDEKIRICRSFFLLLADRYGWHKVNASQSRELVHKDMVKALNFR